MSNARVHIVCYGCQMNRLDAGLVAEVLRESGAEVVADPAAANVLLFLTCSVRAHAENRVFSNIGALAARKTREPGLLVGLLGCMAQQHGPDLMQRAPLVDFACAPGRLAELPDLLARAERGERPVALDPTRAGDRAEGYPPWRAFGTADAALDRLEVRAAETGAGPGQAYVRAMRGCDNFCAYCVVPHVRGPERSRPPAAVLEEVRRAVERGACQVTLLGQAVNKYRFEEEGRAWDLAALLEAAAAVRGLSRLDFLTNHPRAMTARLVAVFRNLPPVCPYLHMPAQAGSDAVLRRMNRGYTAAEYLERVAMVRQAAPQVAVHSDFIVGFPGETEADFEATLDLVRRMRPAGAFVFKYSPRPGTLAARDFADDVPLKEKRRRNQALLDLVGRIAAEDNQAFVGREVEVLVEGSSPQARLRAATGRSPWRTAGAERSPSASDLLPPASGLQLRGRTRCHRLVVFDGPPEDSTGSGHALAGREVRVRVEAAGALTLFAALLPDK